MYILMCACMSIYLCANYIHVPTYVYICMCIIYLCMHIFIYI